MYSRKLWSVYSKCHSSSKSCRKRFNLWSWQSRFLMTKIESFDFLNNLLLAIIQLHVVLSVILIARRWSYASKTSRFFRDLIAVFISEELDVSIKNCSRYHRVNEFLQKLLYFLDVCVNDCNALWLFWAWDFFFNLSQLENV